MAFYFAYGSNMNKERLTRRVGSCDTIGVGKLSGYKLVFNKRLNNGSAAANIIKCEGSNVYGIIYRLTKDAFNILDKYEGVKSGHYHRHIVTVSSSDQKIECIAYIAGASYIDDNVKPTTEYLGFLLSASDVLPSDYVEALKRVEFISCL